MNGSHFSAQTMAVNNPLRYVGMADLLLGTIKCVSVLVVVLTYQGALSDLISGASTPEPQGVVVLLGLSLAALLIGVGGITDLIKGIGLIGRLVVPPRAPADFADYEEDVGIPLARRELPAYQLPDSAKYQLAYRLFPNRFPMLTRRLREQLSIALGSALATFWLVLLFVVANWGMGLLDARSASFQFSSIDLPLLPLLGLVIASGVRIWFVTQSLPTPVPQADRDEFRMTMSGGGDPNLIPIGLEHVLLAQRPPSGAPNRGKRFGFKMDTDGVTDAGEYFGTVIVETQPTIVAGAETVHGAVALVVAIVLAAPALYLALVLPGFLPTIGQLDQPALIAWSARLLEALLLLRAAAGIVTQVHHFGSVFEFDSLAIAVQTEGTFGRAKIKVGKSIHDSIESDNLVIRSDSAVTGYVARIRSESIGLTGERSITSMGGDGATITIQKSIEDWFRQFRSTGTDIAGVDLQSTKLAHLVEANVAIDAQRAKTWEGQHNKTLPATDSRAAQASLSPPSNGRKAADGSPADSSQLDRVDAKSTQSDDFDADNHPPESVQGWKECPDCAEQVRKRARKCRYCNFEFPTARGG